MSNVPSSLFLLRIYKQNFVFTCHQNPKNALPIFRLISFPLTDYEVTYYAIFPFYYLLSLRTKYSHQ
jgi:hypothetical protein